METDTKKTEVQCTKDRKPDPEILKTWEIWNEAGFTPPEMYMDLVELLHLIHSGDLSPGCADEKQIADGNFSKYCSGPFSLDFSFDIHDPIKMHDYARSNNIPEEKLNDVLVAVSITAAIISDYFVEEFCP